MKETRPCAWCGSPVTRYASQFKDKPHVFCSRSCLAAYKSTENPERPTWKRPDTSARNQIHNAKGQKPETREKLRAARLGTGQQKGYGKIYGKAEHRVVAEKMLGRPLRPGEVVHHIDRNKRNNSPENLMVFRSQKEHAAWHAEHDGKEVVPDEVHTS